MSITELSAIKEQRDYLIFSKEVVHPHSPAIGKLIDLFLNHFKDAIAQINTENGKQVVLADFFPEYLLYAADCIPLGIADLARLSTSEDISNSEKFFQIPAETCPMVKSKIAGLYLLKDTPVKKSIVGSVICEPHVCAISLMKDFGFEEYWLDGFQKFAGDNTTRYELVINTYRKEVEQLFYWLTGKACDKEKLGQVLKRLNRVHHKIDEILALQRQHPSYMKSLPAMLLISGRNGFYGKPDYFEDIVDELLIEFKNLKAGEFNEKCVDLTWTGVRGVDFSVYNAFDVNGGNIVAWTIAGSDSKFFDEEIDPLESFIQYNISGMINARMEDAAEREAKLYEKTNSKGIVVYGTLGCTNFTINREVSRRILSEKGIPTLAIQGTPLIGESTGQLFTRVKAFIEMLS